MAKIIGREVNLGVAREETRGTPVDPLYWVQKATCLIIDKVEKLINNETLGVIEDADDAKIATKSSEGTFAGKIGLNSFGLFLLNVFGAVQSEQQAPPNDTVYQHTFTVAQDHQHDSLTLTVSDGIKNLKFPLSMIKTLKIDCVVGDFVRFTIATVGSTGTSFTGAVAYEKEKNFIARDTIFKMANDLAGLPDATAIKVKSISLTFNQNVEPNFVLGQYTPEDNPNKEWSVEGEVVLDWEGSTYYDLYVENTLKAVRVEMTSEDVIGSSLNPKLTIDFAKCAFTELSKTGGVGDIITQTLRFKPLFSLSDSLMAKAVLVNEVENYVTP